MNLITSTATIKPGNTQCEQQSELEIVFHSPSAEKTERKYYSWMAVWTDPHMATKMNGEHRRIKTKSRNLNRILLLKYHLRAKLHNQGGWDCVAGLHSSIMLENFNTVLLFPLKKRQIVALLASALASTQNHFRRALSMLWRNNCIMVQLKNMVSPPWWGFVLRHRGFSPGDQKCAFSSWFQHLYWAWHKGRHRPYFFHKTSRVSEPWGDPKECWRPPPSLSSCQVLPLAEETLDKDPEH